MLERKLKSDLIELLTRAVSSRLADGVMLSGGIDSSLLAVIASGLGYITGVTGLYDDVNSNDEHYSSIVANKFNIRHLIKKYGLEEAMEGIEEVVRITRKFDHIAIRNDLTIYFALKSCAENGIECVITGDGADELFAGYDYITKMTASQYYDYVNSLSTMWTFSAPLLAASLGIKVVQPYLDTSVVEFTKRLPYELIVRRSEAVYGKWILRSILNDLGLPEIAYRRKEPIELGSGSAIITKILLEKLGDEAKKIEEEALRDGVKFWSLEQAYFYKIFKELFGETPKAKDGENGCACCGAPINPRSMACKICGFLNEATKNG